MKAEYTISAIVSGVVVVGLLFLFLASPAPVQQGSALSPTGAQTKAVSTGVPYTEIVNPSGFVNTDGVTIKELVGKKVIVVDFLTYSCINCQRTFPYMKALYATYKDQGLEIIGIHTPEFAFEKDIDNVRKAMKTFGITYPIVLDNDYATWNAYGNQYWPRKYIIDIYGNVVYDHIGEGSYEETEMKIRELLAERAQVLGMNAPATDSALAVSEMPAEITAAESPETYFGSSRNRYLANGTPGRAGEQTFSLPQTSSPNVLYLGGTWSIAPEYAESVSSASAVYRYNAKNVYIVAEADTAISVEVLQDGMPVGDAGGEDVSGGVVVMKESRLYKLIRNPQAGEHVLKLNVKGKGLRLYAFTFG
ncbi:MAG: redoxin family protein [Patescibacteria group bacterium]|nr:redoxin family protein [Patescibacteria group bacterium]